MERDPEKTPGVKSGEEHPAADIAPRQEVQFPGREKLEEEQGPKFERKEAEMKEGKGDMMKETREAAEKMEGKEAEKFREREQKETPVVGEEEKEKLRQLSQQQMEQHEQRPEKQGLKPEQQEEQQGAEHEKKLPKTMKAMRVVEFGKPLELQEVDVPRPGYREVLVQVTFSGVCHTDLNSRDGAMPSVKPDHLPRTLGHEGVGKVYATGPGVTRVQVGDRVCCNSQASACLCCEECCAGLENCCSEAKIGSAHHNGHFAQFFLAKEHFLCPIPDNVSDEEAAPINCAGVTGYRALKVSGLRCGQWVVLCGVAGGVGYYACQFAKAMGLKVIAVDKGKEKVDRLKHCCEGIYACLDVEESNISEKINQLTKKGAHGAIIIAPSAEAFQEAPNFLRHRGKIVVLGNPRDGVAKFDMSSLIMKCITMTGSLIGSRADLLEALQLVADGTIKSEPTVRELSELNDILDEFSQGKMFGRNVVRIPQGGEQTVQGLRRKSAKFRRMLESKYHGLLEANRRFAEAPMNLIWPVMAVAVALFFTFADRLWDIVQPIVQPIFQ